MTPRARRPNVRVDLRARGRRRERGEGGVGGGGSWKVGWGETQEGAGGEGCVCVRARLSVSASVCPCLCVRVSVSVSVCVRVCVRASVRRCLVSVCSGDLRLVPEFPLTFTVAAVRTRAHTNTHTRTHARTHAQRPARAAVAISRVRARRPRSGSGQRGSMQTATRIRAPQTTAASGSGPARPAGLARAADGPGPSSISSDVSE